MEELQSFIGKRIDLKKVQEEQNITWKGYWKFHEGCHCIFKGKEMTANILSANWVGSVGQTTYFINGNSLEADPEEKTSYSISLLLSEMGDIEDFEVYSETGSGCLKPPRLEEENNLPYSLAVDFIDKLEQIIKNRFFSLYQPNRQGFGLNINEPPCSRLHGIRG